MAAEVDGRRRDKDNLLLHWRIVVDKNMRNNDSLEEDHND